jgi:DNA-binding MarR family transcriptional regulator
LLCVQQLCAIIMLRTQHNLRINFHQGGGTMNSSKKIGDLIIEVNKNLKTMVERDLKEYEIGMGQLQILMVFFNEMESLLTQNELVKILDVDKGNISRSVLKLSTKGYLEKVEGKKHFRLSEKGKKLKSGIIPKFININAIMISEMEATQIDQTILMLSKINENLENNI